MNVFIHHHQHEQGKYCRDAHTQHFYFSLGQYLVNKEQYETPGQQDENNQEINARKPWCYQESFNPFDLPKLISFQFDRYGYVKIQVAAHGHIPQRTADRHFRRIVSRQQVRGFDL